MPIFVHMASSLLAAAAEFASADDFLSNFDKYMLAYDDVQNMGFDVADDIVCRLIINARCDVQSVCNAILTLHIQQ